MKTPPYRSFLWATLACLLALSSGALAQDKPIADAAAPATNAPQPELKQPELEPPELERPATAGEQVEAPAPPKFGWRIETDYGDHRNVIIHFGRDSHLGAAQAADALISIVGSSTSEGEINDVVVSVFGNTRVTGPVRNSAIAVFGDTYVNSHVGGEVVAVFGNVELGPQAQVEGDIVAIGGTVDRDAASVVHGDIQEISFPGAGHSFAWLHPWLKNCLLYGRPLALEPGLGWAWTLAFGFLALYVLLALLFSDSVEKCAETLETRPGHSLLAALLVMLLIPALIGLLCITIIGIPLVPFVGMALFCAGLFGKAVMLAAIGRRLTSFIGTAPVGDVAFAVLVGGFVVLGLYLIPILGFIIYKLLGILGMGVVAYTLLLTVRARRRAAASAAPMEVAATIDTMPGVNPAAAESAAPAQVDPATATTDPRTTLPRAGFWIRMAALFIDTLVISAALGFLHDSGELTLLALATYGSMMWKFKGTTLGGIVCNLQVVRLDGREIDWGTAIVRALGCFLSLVAGGLGFLWIAIDKENQAWHDKIAGTVVVRVRHGVSSL
jgi:uncharacterized RDD family membrane protein YckC